MTINNSINNSNSNSNSQMQSDAAYPVQSIDWLTRLIGFDTVSRHSNLALIEDVKSYCEQLGLTVDLTFNEAQNKANLFVTVPAGGNANNSADQVNHGLVLSGHTDVVPVDGQEWTSAPFTATIRGDKLYGRGACDMKGFIACALTLLPQAVQLSRANQLRRPLHLALSFDEEVGCLGAPLILADLKARGITPIIVSLVSRPI